MTDREAECIRQAARATLANALGLQVTGVKVFGELDWHGKEEPWTRLMLALAGEVAIEVSDQPDMRFSEDREELRRLAAPDDYVGIARGIVRDVLVREQDEVQAIADQLERHDELELAE